MNVTLRPEVLKLNKLHQPLGFFTPKEIFVDLANWEVDRWQNYVLDSRGNKIRKMLAYDIVFPILPDGSYDFSKYDSMRVVDWDEWVTLPIRSFDLSIATPRFKVRVPRIVVSLRHEDMPKTKHNTSLQSVYELYDGTCYYSKRKLSKNEATRDHVIPTSKGGKNVLSNIVLCDAKINHRKGDHYNYEVGLPEAKPIVPREIPVKDTLRNTKNIPEWNWILKKGNK